MGSELPIMVKVTISVNVSFKIEGRRRLRFKIRLCLCLKGEIMGWKLIRVKLIKVPKWETASHVIIEGNKIVFWCILMVLMDAFVCVVFHWPHMPRENQFYHGDKWQMTNCAGKISVRRTEMSILPQGKRSFLKFSQFPQSALPQYFQSKVLSVHNLLITNYSKKKTTNLTKKK